MESLPDVWLSYPAPWWWSTTSNHAKTGPIYFGAGQTSSLRECDYSTKWVEECCWTEHFHANSSYNRLRQSGIRSRRACIRIPLTRLHKQARLNWAQNHVNWTDSDWDHVPFTDESNYCLDVTDRRAPLWRRSGERLQDANISEHDRYGGCSIMVGAGISRDGRTDLHTVIRGMLADLRYGDEILDVCVRPYAGAIGSQFILMDDNARPHRARVVEEYLQQETIARMDWPAC